MKRSFSFELKPVQVLLPFVLYWVAFILFEVYAIRFQGTQNASDPAGTLRSLLVFYLYMGVFILVNAIITPMLAEKMIGAASFDGLPFSFKGKIFRFAVIYFFGFILTMITLGIYGPWYYKSIINYFAVNTEYKGKTFSFGGKPVWMLLLIFGMIVVITVPILIAFYGRSGAKFAGLFLPIVILVMMIPLIYLVYKWVINFSFDGSLIVWKTKFWPSCGILIKEFFLTAVTLGIYFPVAYLHLLGYFAERTVVLREGKETGHFSFSASTGEGFGLIWIQTLLSVITLGFYIPWAWARIGKWAAKNISLVENL